MKTPIRTEREVSPQLRLSAMAMVIVSLFGALFVRLWYLQGVVGESLVDAVQQTSQKSVYIPAPRGRILDRNGIVLVDNRVVSQLTIDRSVADKDPDVVVRLASVLNTPVDTLNDAISDQRQSRLRPAVLSQDVDVSKIAFLKEHQDQFPGVQYSQTTERVYPQGSVAAHVLGYIGGITEDDLKSNKSEYQRGDDIGKSGIESAYEKILRGTPGRQVVEVDLRNRVVRIVSETQPVPGADLYLTIDLGIQKAAEQGLIEGLMDARTAFDDDTGKHFVAPAGAAVATDPRDGSIVAMASYPSYDPASFVGGISNDQFSVLQNPANYSPLNNRATQGLYAPGSTFKMVTAVAALSSGLISPSTYIEDRGSYTVEGKCSGRCTFNNANKQPFGAVNMARAISVSSDVYFYRLGDLFYQERSKYGDAIQDVARSFGLGTVTGIEIEETDGRISDQTLREELHKSNPKNFPEGRWFVGDNIFTAIGQSETVITPLQLAGSYAAFANGGTVWIPHLGARALDANGNEIFKYTPSSASTVDLSPSVRSVVAQGLDGAVNSESGTAYAVFRDSGLVGARWRAAGKTGTAQVVGKQDTAVFAAYAPVDNPEIALSVVMEESGFGGVSAAPVGKRILQVAAGLAATKLSLGNVND